MIDARRKWYLKNKALVNARAKAKYKKRYASDPEYRKRLIACTMKSFNKHRAKRLAYKVQAHARNMKTNIEYRLEHSVRNRINGCLARNKCQRFYSYKVLTGCSWKDLKIYLEARFKPGMSWDNYGFSGWHIDHVEEICSFDLKKPSQQKKAFNYKNLQPLWAWENFGKRDKYISATVQQNKRLKKQIDMYKKLVKELR